MYYVDIKMSNNFNTRNFLTVIPEIYLLKYSIDIIPIDKLLYYTGLHIFDVSAIKRGQCKDG